MPLYNWKMPLLIRCSILGLLTCSSHSWNYRFFMFPFHDELKKRNKENVQRITTRTHSDPSWNCWMDLICVSSTPFITLFLLLCSLGNPLVQNYVQEDIEKVSFPKEIVTAATHCIRNKLKILIELMVSIPFQVSTLLRKG